MKMGDYAICNCFEPIVKTDWKGFKRCGWCMKPIIKPTKQRHTPGDDGGGNTNNE